jgi:hypothetical protein
MVNHGEMRKRMLICIGVGKKQQDVPLTLPEVIER